MTNLLLFLFVKFLLLLTLSTIIFLILIVLLYFRNVLLVGGQNTRDQISEIQAGVNFFVVVILGILSFIYLFIKSEDKLLYLNFKFVFQSK